MTKEKAVQIRQVVTDPKRIVVVNRTIPPNAAPNRGFRVALSKLPEF
jgi:hypothetical protein